MEVPWQDKFNSIEDRRLHLLRIGTCSDCRFQVGCAPENQKIITGHKLILAMSSPVFECMFYGQLPEKDDLIVIPDVNPEAFQAMLEYIYCDRINIRTLDNASELIYLAEKYMLPHVLEVCTQYLLSNLSSKNACRIYELAKLLNQPRLLESSMERIVGYTLEVLEDPSFIDIEISTLMMILDQEHLNIDSEMDLFNAIQKISNERYVVGNEYIDNTGQCNVQNLSISANSCDNKESDLDEDEDNNENNCHNNSSSAVAAVEINASNVNYLMDTKPSIVDEEMLRKAVKKIRFLTMTPQQFAKGPACSKLLKQHEVFAIIMKISNPTSNDFQMPEGFCSSSCSRIKLITADAIRNKPRSYCICTSDNKVERYLSGLTECSTFKVDTNIWITGIKILMKKSGNVFENNKKKFYARIHEGNGPQQSYTTFTSEICNGSEQEISFCPPIYIKAKRIYKIFVEFSPIGLYQVPTPVPDAICNSVKFDFIGDAIKYSTSNIIRAIVFVKP